MRSPVAAAAAIAAAAVAAAAVAAIAAVASAALVPDEGSVPVPPESVPLSGVGPRAEVAPVGVVVPESEDAGPAGPEGQRAAAGRGVVLDADGEVLLAAPQQQPGEDLVELLSTGDALVASEKIFFFFFFKSALGKLKCVLAPKLPDDYCQSHFLHLPLF